jgi:hypothetical protein
MCANLTNQTIGGTNSFEEFTEVSPVRSPEI